MADAEVLFRLHRDRIFRYLYRAAGHIDTAHELTQEVFLRVSRTAVPKAATVRWQRGRIARNLVLDHKRRLGRRPEPSASPQDIGGRSASQETATAVDQALASPWTTTRRQTAIAAWWQRISGTG